MTKRNNKGQTLIETALVLMLLLVIFIGTAEIARAWYVKNSLKNAVRSGARVAVVTPAAGFPSGAIGNTTAVHCPSANTIINTVCTSPGVKNDSSTQVLLFVSESNIAPEPDSIINSGDTVTVQVTATFDFVIGGHKFNFLGVLPVWPWPKSTSFTTDASMRYE